MRRHPPPWLSWPLAAASVVLTVMGIALVWLRPGLAEALLSGSAAGFTIDTLQLLGAPLVGAVVASRRPEHPYGWLLLSLGLTGAALGVSATYATLALIVADGALPFGWVAAWLADVLWGVMILHLPFLFLLFPDGHLPSPSWRWFAWAIVGLALLMYAVGTFVPGSMGSVPIDRPTGVGGTAGAVFEGILHAASYGLIGAAALAAISVFARRRRAGPQERLQLKWFAYAAGLFAVVTATIATAGVLIDMVLMTGVNAWIDIAGPILFGVAMNAVFVAIGVAVLRYRLYEIDRIVSRTVSYALLTALLVGVYVSSVLLLSRLLVPIAAGSELAVAAATLAAVGVFAPARRRIQAGVDRRFNRARYDAEQVLAAFRERLRGEIDLEDVVAATRIAAVGAVQPARASLWMVGREALS